MAKVEIETLTDDCYKVCDDFDVVLLRLYSDGKTYHNIVKCSNVDRCRIIKRHIESLPGSKGGDVNAD